MKLPPRFNRSWPPSSHQIVLGDCKGFPLRTRWFGTESTFRRPTIHCRLFHLFRFLFSRSRLGASTIVFLVLDRLSRPHTECSFFVYKGRIFSLYRHPLTPLFVVWKSSFIFLFQNRLYPFCSVFTPALQTLTTRTTRFLCAFNPFLSPNSHEQPRRTCLVLWKETSEAEADLLENTY